MRIVKTLSALSLTAVAFALGHATSVAGAPQQAVQKELKAMEAGFDALGTTGKMHELLQPFVGTWTAKATFYTPAGEMTSTGKMTNSWIMDGKILQQEYTGTYQNEPFQGLGLWAFSMATNEYQSVWVDSATTAIEYTSGHQVSPDGKSWTVKGLQSIAPGQQVPFEDVIEIRDPKKEHRLTRTLQTASGPVKSMEIVYTR